MSWDEEKDTFAERPDVPANQKITSAEWNEHVSDQKDHSERHEETGSDSLGVFDLVGSLTGQGLERVGDSLQVLSSIWDGENITANVDNESVDTEVLGTVPQLREQADTGSGSKADPFVIAGNPASDYTGLLNFGKGWFETSGIESDPDNDYAEESLYLQGDGIRTTTLLHESDAPETPTVLFQDPQNSGGNFGGIRDMTVYGAGEGDESGTANIVESDGGIIDLQFENVIIRYGGGDAIHTPTSAGGYRIQNAWLEDVGGWGVHTDTGRRMKFSDIHIFSCGGGIRSIAWHSEFSGITIIGTSDDPGMNLLREDNTLNNIYFEDIGDTALQLGSNAHGTVASNIVVREVDNTGVQTTADRNQFSNIGIIDWGREGGFVGARLLGDYGTLHNCVVGQTDATNSTDALAINGDRNHVNGFYAWDPSVSWTAEIASGSTECVLDNIYGLDYADITDNGTRTLINGWGTNAGDPTTDDTTQWHGHADYAGERGATIWDTTTTPWTPYEATPDGTWV